MRKPDSSTKTRWAPSREVFFDARPLAFLPVLDALFIAFHRTAFRLLMGPAQTVQKASYVISVVADVEGLANQSGDACSGPDLCSVAMRNRSLEQQFDQPLTLSRVQLGGASWRESYP